MCRVQEHSLKSELKAIQEKAARLAISVKDLLLNRARRTVIKCYECKKGSRLSKWKFIQDWWYQSARSCNEGAEWYPSEVKLCHIVCPKCDEWNYLCNHKQQKQILELLEDRSISKHDVFDEVWKKVGDNEPTQVFADD